MAPNHVYLNNISYSGALSLALKKIQACITQVETRSDALETRLATAGAEVAQLNSRTIFSL